MEYFEKLLVENWPTWVLIVFGAGSMYSRLRRVDQNVREMRNHCQSRLKWCLDHFKFDKDVKQISKEE